MPDDMPLIGTERPTTMGIDVCPGKLVRLPAVAEAAQAYAALEHGALGVYFPGHEATVLDAALAMASARKRYEAEQLAKRGNNIG